MENFEINDLSPDERHTLARKAGISFIYLWQYGAGIRRPRLELAEKLMKFEPRLTIAGILAPMRRRKIALKAKQKKAK